jgi:prevent-host-death family protein
MMTEPATIDVIEAKIHLSALIDRAAAGEEIILSRAGRPLARLVPLAERAPRQPGVRRDWQIPDELSLKPADEAELAAAAEGIDTDALGLSRRRTP